MQRHAIISKLGASGRARGIERIGENPGRSGTFSRLRGHGPAPERRRAPTAPPPPGRFGRSTLSIVSLVCGVCGRAFLHESVPRRPLPRPVRVDGAHSGRRGPHCGREGRLRATGAPHRPLRVWPGHPVAGRRRRPDVPRGRHRAFETCRGHRRRPGVGDRRTRPRSTERRRSCIATRDPGGTRARRIDFTISLTYGGGPDLPETVVPEGKLLVLGDNRGNSHDGRSFGFVDSKAVLGRAAVVLGGRGVRGL